MILFECGSYFLKDYPLQFSVIQIFHKKVVSFLHWAQRLLLSQVTAQTVFKIIAILSVGSLDVKFLRIM
jgi:hypothetical protein